jgi:hypothetical protein
MNRSLCPQLTKEEIKNHQDGLESTSQHPPEVPKLFSRFRISPHQTQKQNPE